MDSSSGTAGQNHHTGFAPFAQHPGIPILASAFQVLLHLGIFVVDFVFLHVKKFLV